MDSEKEDGVSSLDAEIVKLQRSTRTTVPAMLPLHDVLRSKYRWYYKWHLIPGIKAIHTFILLLFLFFLGTIFYQFMSSEPKEVLAVASNVLPSGDSVRAWTVGAGCTATTHYDCVNDAVGAPDSDTSYLTATTAVADYFSHAAGTYEDITNVKVKYQARALTAGARVAASIRIGTTNYTDATPDSMTTGYAAYENSWALNPSNSAEWTDSDIDSLGFGFVSSTSAANSPRVTQAYLEVTQVPNAPTIGAASGLSATSIRWGWTDNSSIESGYYVQDASDVNKCTAAANAATCDEGSLTVNTQYTRHVNAYDATGQSVDSGNASKYTLANTPNLAPTVATATETTINVTPRDTQPANNPATTEYAIACNAGGTSWLNGATNQCENYAEANIPDNANFWKTIAGWGTQTVASLVCNTSYSFEAKARNGDKVGTNKSASGTLSTSACTINISGNIYQANGSTLDTTGYTIGAYVNGSSSGVTDVVAPGSSSYGLDVPVSSGQPILVYISGHANNANAFTITDGTSDVTGFHLIVSDIMVGSDNGSTATTNANICAAASTPPVGDSLYSCSGNNLTLTDSTVNFMILTSKKYDTGASAALNTNGGSLGLYGSSTATISTTNSSVGAVTINTGATLVTANGINLNTSGTWTNSGSYTANSGTITFNNTTAGQTLAGTTATAFNNLTLSNTNRTLTVNTSFSIAGTLTVNANTTLSPTAGVIISGAGTLTGSGTAIVKTNAANAFATQYSISNKTLTNLTVDYNGSSASGQTFSNITYGNLKVTGTLNSLDQSATVAGVFTHTSGTFTPASGTITLNNGASLSTSSGTTFQGLTIADGATVSTASAFKLAGALSVGTGSTFSTGTVTTSGAAWTIANSGSLTFGGLTVANTPNSQTGASFDAGNLAVSAGANFIPTGTITISGITVNATGSAIFQNLTVDDQITSTSNFTVQGVFNIAATGQFNEISAGTVTMDTTGWSITNGGFAHGLALFNLVIAETPTSQSSFNAYLYGTLTVNSGKTFAPTGGLITTYLTDWAISNSGSLTFSGLTINGTPSTQPTADFSVSGTLTVNAAKTLAPTSGTITMTGGSIVNNGGAATNLVFNNLTSSGAVATSSSFQVANDFLINSGTFTVSSGTPTITVGDDFDLTGGSISAGSSKIVMTGLGAGKTIVGNAKSLYDLQISGNILATTSNIGVSGTLTVDDTKTLTIDTGRQFSMNNGATTTINGTIASNTTGYIVFWDGAGSKLSTSGTLSANAIFAANTTDATVPARTYGGYVRIYGYATDKTVTLGTAADQLIEFSSYFQITANNTGNIAVTAATYNPTINVSGNILFSASSTGRPSLSMGSGTWTASGDVNLGTVGTITADSSTLVMDGASKTLTPNDQTFNDLTFSNTTLCSGDLTVNGTLNVNGGNFSPSAGTVTMATTGWRILNSGTLVFSGLTIAETPSAQTSASFSVGGTVALSTGKTFSPTAGTITMTGTGWGMTSDGTLQFKNLIIAGTPSSQSNISFTMNGDLTVNSGKNFSPTSGVIVWGSSGNIINSGTLAFVSVTINEGVTVGTSSDFSVGTNLNNAGTFTATAGTITLSGAGGTTQTVAGPGSTTFNNLVATAALARTIRFVGNSATTVSGIWTVTGAPDQLITLDSSDSNNWTINPAAANISYASVAHSNSGLAICATYSSDGLNNNANWDFSDGAACVVVPTVTIQDITNNNTGTSVTFNGNITDTGGENVTERGFKYNAGGSCDDSESVSDSGSFGAGAFSKASGVITSATAYSVRAFATNSAGTNYSACVQFETPTIPTVDVAAASGISSVAATLNGDITDTGIGTPASGVIVTERGFRIFASLADCSGDADLSAIQNPHENDYITGFAAEPFNIATTDALNAHTDYWYKAYAKNSSSSTRGSSACQKFTTIDTTITMSVQAADGITDTTATLNGTIEDILDGPSTDKRGFKFYEDSQNCGGSPTEIKEIGAYGEGAYSLSAGTLTPNTYYSYKSYAVNSAGIDELSPTCESFITLAAKPDAFTVSPQSWDGTGNLVNITTNSNGNPAGTKFYIQAKEIDASDQTPQVTCDNEAGWFALGAGDGWGQRTNGVQFTDYRTADNYVCYRAKAKNQAGTETAYSDASAVVMTAPAQPTLSGTISTYAPTITKSSIAWVWNPNEVAPTGYRVNNTANNYQVCSAVGDTTCTQTLEAAGNTLDPNAQYTIKVKAYRGSLEGQPSVQKSAYTAIEAVSGVTATFAATSVSFSPNNSFSNLASDNSGLQFCVNRAADDSLVECSAWVQVADAITISSLTPNTQYKAAIQSRNGDSRTTAAAVATSYTASNPPANIDNYKTSDKVTSTSITWHWEQNSNPAGTRFCIADNNNCTTSTELSYTIPNATPNTLYNPKFYSLNENGVRSDYVYDTDQAATAIEKPTATSEFSTINHIAFKISNLTNVDSGNSGMRVNRVSCTDANAISSTAPELTDWFTSSASINDNPYVVLDGPFAKNTSCNYSLKARNREGVETGSTTRTFETGEATNILVKLPGQILADGSLNRISLSGSPDGEMSGCPLNEVNVVAVDDVDYSNRTYYYRDQNYNNEITLKCATCTAPDPTMASDLDELKINTSEGRGSYTGLKIKQAGRHRLQATGSLGYSDWFTVLPDKCSSVRSSVNPASATIGTRESQEFTVTLSDQYGNKIANHAISVSSTSSDDVIDVKCDKTDINGQCKFTVTSEKSHTSTLTVRDTNDLVTLTTQPELNFVFSGPTDPTNLRATNIGSTVLDIAWDASTDDRGVAGYQVYNADTDILVGTTQETEYAFENLTPNSQYRFKVRAYDEDDQYSGYSNILDITTHSSSADDEDEDNGNNGSNGGGGINAGNKSATGQGARTSFLLLGNVPSEVGVNSIFSDVKVTAADAGGKIINNYAKSIYFTSTDESAKLPYLKGEPYKFSHEDKGFHQFADEQFSFGTVGAQKLTVTDGSVSSSQEVDVLPASKAIEQVKDYVSKSKNMTKFNTGVITASAVVLLAPILLNTTVGLSNIGAELLYWFAQVLQFLGIRKRHKPWGVVFDANNGHPLPLALVRIYDKRYNKQMQQVVTDEQGRYGFLVKPGEYYITAAKAGYNFKPDKNGSTFYEKVYNGEPFKITDNKLLVGFNIALNPAENLKTIMKLWTIIIKINKFLQKIRLPILAIGLIFAIVMTIVAYHELYALSIAFYVLVGILDFMRTRKARPYGVVTDVFGHPLETAIVRIYKKSNNRLVGTDVTDDEGRFKFLVSPGLYYITASKPSYIEFKSHLMYLEKERTLVSTTVKMKKKDSSETE